MDYRFNYSTLKKWTEANPKISKREIARSLGITDATGLNNWIEGKTTIPLDHLLRFCNRYQVPLERFFLDNEYIPSMDIPAPKEGDITEPLNGYTAKNNKGGRHNAGPKCDARTYSHIPSVGVRIYEELSHEPDPAHVIKEERPSADTTQLMLEHQKEINLIMAENHNREDKIRKDCQDRYDKERDTLLELIKQLQQENQRQSTELNRIRVNTSHYSYVGESDPSKK